MRIKPLNDYEPTRRTRLPNNEIDYFPSSPEHSIINDNAPVQIEDYDFSPQKPVTSQYPHPPQLWFEPPPAPSYGRNPVTPVGQYKVTKPDNYDDYDWKDLAQYSKQPPKRYKDIL